MNLSSFCLRNFKAAQNSKSIRFTPLTVFIGNNGSGKSSIVEAMETFQSIVLKGLDEAMASWYGFEHILNKAKEHKTIKDKVSNPMTFTFHGKSEDEKLKFHLEVVADSTFNRIYFQDYKAAYHFGELTPMNKFISKGEITDPKLKTFVSDWQFLRLDPHLMTEPMPQERSYGVIKLNHTGSNIADYLQSIRDLDLQSFNGIIEAFKGVLPFAEDLQPAVASELDRKVYLTMSEENITGKLPGWLLSTGTLRILALLAVLRHPKPPPVIIIEEIENGLDPRTIHLLVDEIRYFVESKRGQVIATTHSPYFLDLLKLSQIVVVERDESGSPVFTRPGSKKSLEDWAQKFSPGKLYTMGKLKRS
ncbi:MAG: AAA family ATPase [Deltaproteobacteria bacterium]|nr:AAA family ATPase [Deltaproteobacteria bacterium]MBW2336973.1 AAA family ATPase [Deltaproteobacteria bacterium]MBW2704689.1 AAA family ATPase [Deltaproteobacteria bacterium]